ncbi:MULTISPECIES: YihY/virulence factor BrkB family protein [Paracoccus]|uniref:YihY/virulence factor BrkB family protein n=1 Tax=Paracoccus TaxID=265 RepID=UPI001FB6E5F4|nr:MULTISPECIES: YihY/virulence factor BrkB family protein [Paracoccus]MCJ1902427.1 YihY/virulence factor BrkB family protein [Paracoccus versutus]MDF3907318.1 YihY/virulence factor BrkB family protein [Paracoccus sp. AS002]
MPTDGARLADDLGHAAETPARIPLPGWRQIFRRVRAEIAQDHVGVVAAGIAFYGLIAIFPAIAALVAISGLVLDPADLGSTMERIFTLLPPDAAGIIRDQLVKVTDGGTQTGLVAISGLAVAIYGATKGVMTLIEGLNIAYDEDETRGLLRLYLTGFALTLGLVVGLTVAIGLIVLLPLAAGLLHLGDGVQAAISWIAWPILAGSGVLGLAVIYRFGPARKAAKWRWLSLGAALAVCVWIAASLGFSLYASNFARYTETYGTLAGVVGLLTWLWLSAYVVLAGAELNAEIEQQTARDTTTGAPQPMGRRGAVKADTPPPGMDHRDGAEAGAAGKAAPLSPDKVSPDQVSPGRELLLASALALRAAIRMAGQRKR